MSRCRRLTDVQSRHRGRLRLETARITATLIRVTGDWSLAEDCVQDAFARALVDWPKRGIPRNPGAWLTTVAKNRAIDRMRSAASEKKAVRELAILAELEGLPEALPRAAPIRRPTTTGCG